MSSIFSKFTNFLDRIKFKNKQPQVEKYLIIGYPKTGNTWLRVLLGRYCQLLFDLQGDLPLFDNLISIDERIPPVEFTHGNLLWKNQTYKDLNLENTVLAYKQFSIILLVRNIPDILVSLYWQAKTQSTFPFEGTISDFIRDPVQGVAKAIAFFQLWNEGRPQLPRLLLLRYEDLRINTVTEFIRFLQFLNIPVDEKIINIAVDQCNFDNMKKLEAENKKSRQLVYPSSGYPIFASGDIENNQEAYHVRKGEINGYLDYLSDQDIEYLKICMKNKIPAWYGYSDGFWH